MRFLVLLLCLVLGEDNNESDFYGRLGVEKDATIKPGFGNLFCLYSFNHDFYAEITSLVKADNLHLHRVKDYRSLKTGHSKSIQKTGPDHASG